MIKKIIYILLWVYWPCILYGQYSNRQVDSLIDAALAKHRKTGNFDKPDSLYHVALKAANHNKYQKGIVEAYISLGNIQFFKGKYQESIRYLDTAMSKIGSKKDVEQAVKIYAELAKNYLALSYYQKSVSNCNEGLKLAPMIRPDSIRKKNTQYLYMIQSRAYEQSHAIDSFYHTVKRAHALLPDVMSASRLAKYFLVYHKNIDSARYYLDKGQQLWQTGRFAVHQRSILLRNEGLYYFTIGDYAKAAGLYEESIGISQQVKNKEDERTTSKMLYDTYKLLNDPKKEAALERYTQLTDSLQNERSVTAEIPVTKWLEDEKERSGRKSVWLYIIIGVVVLGGAGILYRVKNRARLNIEEKEQLLEEKAMQQDELLKKVNDSYEELITLAKNNDPAFYFRFQEVYPEFEPKLLAILPGLRASELTLCAYVFLGFNTKDIADYTFKAIKTVKNRKYNLRKKFEIPTEEDMSIWFRKMIDL